MSVEVREYRPWRLREIIEPFIMLSKGGQRY
jgi:hypothetical protein